MHMYMISNLLIPGVQYLDDTGGGHLATFYQQKVLKVSGRSTCAGGYKGAAGYSRAKDLIHAEE